MMRLAATLSLAGLACAPAWAAPVTLHNFKYGYEAIDTTMTGYVGVGGFVGEFNGGAANSFVTFCTDLFQSFSWNVTYTNYELVANGAVNGFSFNQAAMLGKLFTVAGPVDNHDSSVAFQLAVWEITHDSAPGSIHSGNFAVEAGGTTTQLALAEAWLATAGSAAAANDYVVTRLYSPTNQDFIIAGRRSGGGTGGQISEPAGLVLASLAFVGLAWTRRRATVAGSAAAHSPASKV